MTMSVARLHANLAAMIPVDPGLKAWANDNFGGRDLTVINGNVKVETIPDKDLPAVVFEMGDMDGGPGDDAEVYIGAGAQDVEQELVASFVWYEPDTAQAFQQRLALPDLVVQFCLKNFSLNASDGGGEACNGVWVARSMSSQGDRAIHPKHWYAFQLRAGLMIQR